jgi:hypothetical protein
MPIASCAFCQFDDDGNIELSRVDRALPLEGAREFFQDQLLGAGHVSITPNAAHLAKRPAKKVTRFTQDDLDEQI